MDGNKIFQSFSSPPPNANKRPRQVYLCAVFCLHYGKPAAGGRDAAKRNLGGDEICGGGIYLCRQKPAMP